MKEQKILFKDGMYLNVRGIKLVYSLIPWNWFWNCMLIISGVLFAYWDYALLGILLDHVFEKVIKDILVQDIVVMLCGKVVVQIFYRYVCYYFYYCGSNVWELSNSLLSKKVMGMDFEYMESKSIQNIRRNVDAMSKSTGAGINRLYWNISSFFQRTAEILVAVIYALYLLYRGRNAFPDNLLNYVLFLVIYLIVICGIIVITAKTGKDMNKVDYDKNEEILPYMRQYNYYSEKYIKKEECEKQIRMFHQQKLLLGHVTGLYHKIFQITNEIEEIKGKGIQRIALMQVLLTGISFYMLGVLAINGAITIGNICLFTGCIGGFFVVFQEWISQIIEIINNTKYVKMYFEFLDMPNKKYEGCLPVEKRDDNKYSIEFRNVSFKYPESNIEVLKDISIKFDIGERLAVVGKNGSGKTTFIKLLCRLYDPTAGEILLNGIDIKKYDYQEYVGLFSVIFQDFHLPAFSVGQNISSSFDYDITEVRDSLIRANLESFIDKLPNGLATCIYTDFDKTGMEISGGEAQKLAIARALYHDTPFVILDEPTSALDPLAEYEVYSKFDELVGTKTAVYISHRLSSCQFCNDILVIEGGKSIQRGTHEELIKNKSGLYYSLWKTQAQYYQN